MPSTDRQGSNPALKPSRIALRECSIAAGTSRVPKASIEGPKGLVNDF